MGQVPAVTNVLCNEDWKCRRQSLMLCVISWEPTGSLASLHIAFLHQLTTL